MDAASRVVVAHRHALIAVGLAETLRRQLPADIRVAAPPAHQLDDVDILVVDPDSAQRWSASTPARRPVAMVVVARSAQAVDPVAACGRTQAWVTTACPVEDLCTAVEEVAHGRCYMSGAVAVDLARRQQGHGCGLTARELDVLRSLKAGRCNKAIAADLDMGLGTVKTHIRAILAKLHASTRTQAMTIAVQRALV